VSLGEDPLDIDIDQLLRESARAAAEFDSAESDESQQQDLQDRQRAGEISLEEAISQTKLATRQYIRRQETWFRRDERITWLDEASDRLAIIEKAILTT